MGYHVFLVGEENFRVCLRQGVYGGASVDRPQTNADIIASFSAIRSGDTIFFYVTNRGIYGLWKAITGAFLDQTPLWQNTQQLFPYRVCFEPIIRHFPTPVALSDILDLRDRGLIWTFDLNTLRRKNHNPITEAEGKQLIRLLLRNNPIFQPVAPIPEPYAPQDTPLPIDLATDARGRLRFEGFLNAWFTRQFVEGRLRHLIGEYRDILNYVPTSFNTVMDLFLTHVTQVDSVDILHKFTCIELKTDDAREGDLHQVIRYENWLVRKLASGDSEMVQPLIVAHDFDDRVLTYVDRRKQIEDKTVRLVAYGVDPGRNVISLEEVSA
jgi:hypothetical protein